ncbi:hypothetical protein [Marinitoga aeolica]|uniref:Uncharacterized protein n=1 Tax=Marinitoga aeolica TaxID=2809031 RepID=A0ABY8PRC8_9BACT|nr:hypothetical protein [Marinitoga aeolica]WGS65172.1 hypothetical protein JRV97_01040 [Marinitoga aeolica]
MNIRELYGLYKENPEKKVFLCFTDKKEKILGEEIFENTLSKEFKYFFISEDKCKTSIEITLKNLMSKIKPKIFETKYGKYKNNIILKVSVDEKSNTLEKILQMMIYYTPHIKIAKDGIAYYLLIEKFNNHLSLKLFLENLKAQGETLLYDVYKECDFKKKIFSRIFVKDEYCVQNYEFTFIQDIMIIDNNIIIDNIKFQTINNFIQFDFSEKAKFEELSEDFMSLYLNLDLIKRKNYKETYRELKNTKKRLERELRNIDRILYKIENNLEYMGGFIIEEDKLYQVYPLLLLYDTEDSDKIKVYLFKSENKYYYFFYGPDYLVPNSMMYKYSEDPNYSTIKLKVLVPSNYQLTPELNISKSDKLFEKFINSITNEDINVEDYILILDFKNKFFDKYGVFIKKDSGITLKDFIEKYVKFESPENFEMYIKDFNIKERSKYEIDLDKNLELFYNSIIEDIDSEIDQAFKKWENSKKEIINIMKEEEEKLKLFINDLNLMKEKIENYFENPTVFNLLNNIINNINTYNKDIKNFVESDELKVLTEDEYENTKKMMFNTLNLLNNLKTNMEEEKNKYNENFNVISDDLSDLIDSLNGILSNYEYLDKKLSEVGGKNEEV